MELPTLLAVLLPLAGLGLLALAARQFVRTRRLLLRCVRTFGTVVGEVRQPDESRVYHFPQVSFRTPDGREVVFQSQLGSSVPARMGDSLPVRYPPERPREAEVDTFASRWLPAIVFGALGDALLMIGVAIWVGWIGA